MVSLDTAPTSFDLHATPSAPQHEPELRELGARSDDGIDVQLLWRPADGAVLLRVSDTKLGERLELRVDPADAVRAFAHPYAYAA